MEKAREELLARLAAFRKARPHEISVVFDGYASGRPGSRVSYYGGIRVIFTQLGEKADDMIKQTLSLRRKGWLVVTADRDIMEHAWAEGSVPVTPERFMAAVSARLASGGMEKPSAAEDEDDEVGGPARKGNPRRLSKKERLLRQALGKL
jgi:predicted RNA-binding protein with PIN domain